MNGEPRCAACNGPLPRHYPPCRVAHPAEISAVMAGLMAMVAIVAAIVSSCDKPQIGPFVPVGAAYCSSDAQCPEGTHCAFPAVDWPARCLEGESDIDTVPGWGRRIADGGAQ